jgi:hypothetical protein
MAILSEHSKTYTTHFLYSDTPLTYFTLMGKLRTLANTFFIKPNDVKKKHNVLK